MGVMVTNSESGVRHGAELEGKIFPAHPAQAAGSEFSAWEKKPFPGSRSTQRAERLPDRRRRLVFAERQITGIGALAFSLTLLSANSPVYARDYAAFAKVSNNEKVLEAKACGKYGGRHISNGEYDLVMSSGRTDDTLYNVIYFGGYQYVTFKIDASNSIARLFGIKTHKIGLCQF
jgi:hypothetical protein